MNKEQLTEALYDAIYDLDERTVLQLLFKGANANGFKNDDTTPLHVALQERLSGDVIDALLQHGANVQQVDAVNRSPWHAYCDNVYEMDYDTQRKGELLLQHGVDVTARDGNGQTGLDTVFSRVRADVAELIQTCAPVKIVPANIPQLKGKFERSR